MSVLNQIRDTLDSLSQNEDVPMAGVWYGSCRQDKLDEWNYFVFNRKKTTKSSNHVDWQTYYEVNIIHEDYIPEGYVETVIKELEAKKESLKLRCTSDDIVYNYIFKGNTNVVVEIATITFYRPEKRCQGEPKRMV